MLLDLFFPNRCLHCNRIIDNEDLVCNICFEEIQFFHFNDVKENSLKERCNLLFPVENAFSLMEFQEESLSRSIVHQLKYKSREKVGKTLAEWTIERLDLSKHHFDLIISVPLHARKQRERGYNQIHLYANILAQHLKIEHHSKDVIRKFYKKSQTFKNRKRRAELENNFVIKENIVNKHVLIIDDVYTTGNTMSQVAWEILKKGGNKVSILVMAVDV